MLTPNQFLRLRRGMVVLFGPNRTPRFVLHGPADDPTRPRRYTGKRKGGSSWVEFAKILPGPYPSYGTSYSIGERHLIERVPMSVARKVRRTLAEIEKSRAAEIGLNWRESYREHKRSWDRIFSYWPERRSRCGKWPKDPWSLR